MNDSQLISLGMVLIVVLMGILVNNFRVGDLAGRFSDINRNLEITRDFLRAEMSNGFTTIRSEAKIESMTQRSEIAAVRSEVKEDIAALRSEVKEVKHDIGALRSDVENLRTDVSGLKTLVVQNHQTTQASLADIDARVSRLEQRAA